VRPSPDSSFSVLGFTILGHPASPENSGASAFTKSGAELEGKKMKLLNA